MKKTQGCTSPYSLDGRIPLRQAIPLGLQHVLAMFVGNLSPLLVIMTTCGITAAGGFDALRIDLLQNAMLVAGLITFIQLYPIGPIGGRLPIVMGTSSGFIGINNAIATSMIGGIAAGTIATDANAGIYAYGAIMAACIVGGAFEMALGFIIKPLRRFFPAIVTGTVVVAIGLSLIPVGINFFGGGGTNVPDFGSLPNLLLGLVTLIAILVFKHAFKGFPSIASVLLGIIVGYVFSFLMGLVLPRTFEYTGVIDGVEQTLTATPAYITQWSKVAAAPWFAIPRIMPVKPVFRLDAIIPMCVMFIVTAVETIGDTSGVTQGGLNREPTDRELSGSVVCDGFGSAVAACFGVLPNTSFSQNVGLVSMTKVVNRFAIAMGAGILVIAGLFYEDRRDHQRHAAACPGRRGGDDVCQHRHLRHQSDRQGAADRAKRHDRFHRARPRLRHRLGDRRPGLYAPVAQVRLRRLGHRAGRAACHPPQYRHPEGCRESGWHLKPAEGLHGIR